VKPAFAHRKTYRISAEAVLALVCRPILPYGFGMKPNLLALDERPGFSKGRRNGRGEQFGQEHC
jgi:hypothetical protein